MAIEESGIAGIAGQGPCVIRFKPEHAALGFYTILTNGQATALRNGIYVVGDSQLELLKKAEIPYELVNDQDT